MTRPYTSWGRFPPARQNAVAFEAADAALPITADDPRPHLPYGNGRSYGDTCLNDGGVLIDCRPAARILGFDAVSGLLHAEAGALLDDVISLCLPQGWFLPVTPGTRFVTLGGAIANDVHGKNHHVAGTFGRHVTRFELLRSDGTLRICSADENADWFTATVGGMGLTGVITRAELRMMRVPGPWVAQTVTRFGGLDEFFAIAGEAESRSAYTVAWVDSLSAGASFGRGLFISGDHAAGDGETKRKTPRAVPFQPPLALINRASLKLFNAAYWRKPAGEKTVGWEPFFYPLDAVRDWNLLYGPKGLVQHQSAIPHGAAREAVADLLKAAAAAGEGSFLTVLKRFGDLPSPGLLSFPRPGVTLTLDFPYRGTRTLRLLDTLDRITLAAGGAVNPYKDARMGAPVFEASFPKWRDILPFRDPKLSSSFWRRVAGGL